MPQAEPAGLAGSRIHECLDDLPAEVAAALREQGSQRQWRRGEVVLTRGQGLDAVVVCLRGRMDVMMGTPSGRDTLLRWLHPGEIVGLSTVLAGLPFPTSIVAAGPGTTLHIERQAFFGVLKRHPEGAIAIAVLLSHRLSEVFRYVEMTSQRPLGDRVRYALKRLARQHGEPLAQGDYKLKITQADLATAAGASRQRVHLALLQLQAQGAVQLGYGAIVVRLERL